MAAVEEQAECRSPKNSVPAAEAGLLADGAVPSAASLRTGVAADCAVAVPTASVPADSVPTDSVNADSLNATAVSVTPAEPVESTTSKAMPESAEQHSIENAVPGPPAVASRLPPVPRGEPPAPAAFHIPPVSPRGELEAGITMSLGPPEAGRFRRQLHQMELDGKVLRKGQEGSERQGIKMEAGGGGMAAVGASDRGLAAQPPWTQIYHPNTRGQSYGGDAGEGEDPTDVAEGPLAAVVTAATAAVKRDIPPPPVFEESAQCDYAGATSDEIAQRLSELRDAFKRQRVYFEEYVANRSRRARRLPQQRGEEQQQQQQQQQESRESEEEVGASKQEPVENDDELADPSFRSKRKEKAQGRERTKRRKVSAAGTGANGKHASKDGSGAASRSKRAAAAASYDSAEEKEQHQQQEQQKPRKNRRGAREPKKKNLRDPNDYDRDLPKFRRKNFVPFSYFCQWCHSVYQVNRWERQPPQWRNRGGYSGNPATAPDGTYACYDCSIALTKRSSCPVCDKQYKKNEPAVAFDNPWIRCDRCHRWIHSKCDDIADIEVYSDANPDHVPYTCPVCRDKERLSRKL